MSCKRRSNRSPKRNKVLMKKIVLLLGLLIPGISFAQQYSISWYKVAGGGGTATGGVYSVSGTIGQHDAGGPMTGGNYSVTGGFWALSSLLGVVGRHLGVDASH